MKAVLRSTCYLIVPHTFYQVPEKMTRFALYIHYPFCSSKCPYCGFASEVETDNSSEFYFERTLDELKHKSQQKPWRGGELLSIYIGGGTPSLMSESQVDRLIGEVRQCFKLTDDIEITLEANPGSVEANKFTEFRHSGINRLSIGAQSFQPDELKMLGRRHSVGDIRQSVNKGREAGFDNISLDLIYALPQREGYTRQSAASFAESVRQAVALDIDHLSAYTLTIEQNTPFETFVRSGTLSSPDPDQAAEHYETLVEIMSEAGYEHYELTNFAKPGRHSRHNCAYWNRTPYLGIGLGSHSFDGERRSWNSRDLAKYIATPASTADPADGFETISHRQAIEEEIYLSLRLSGGLKVTELIEREATQIQDNIANLTKAGFLLEQNGGWRIPESRWLLLDEIVLRLLEVSNNRPASLLVRS